MDKEEKGEDKNALLLLLLIVPLLLTMLPFGLAPIDGCCSLAFGVRSPASSSDLAGTANRGVPGGESSVVEQ